MKQSISRAIAKCEQMKKIWAGPHAFEQIKIVLEAMLPDEEPSSVSECKHEYWTDSCSKCGKRLEEPTSQGLSDMPMVGLRVPDVTPSPSQDKTEVKWAEKSLVHGCVHCGKINLIPNGTCEPTITISRKVAEEWYKDSCKPPLCIYKKDKDMCNELRRALTNNSKR